MFQSSLAMPQLFKDICSDTTEIAYPARYGVASFWLAQLHRPVIAHCVQDKETGDKVKVASWSLHRIADLVVPIYLTGKSFNDNPGTIAFRSGNIVAEELSLYGLKNYIGPGEYTFADSKIKVRKVAAARIWHKGLFKTIDKAIATNGNVVQSVKSGIRASAAEAVYIGVTQVVHALAPSPMHDYVQMILPENAYIHSNVQNLVKMAITSVASAMLAACVI
jgi:hypothetical protein